MARRSSGCTDFGGSTADAPDLLRPRQVGRLLRTRGAAQKKALGADDGAGGTARR